MTQKTLIAGGLIVVAGLAAGYVLMPATTPTPPATTPSQTTTAAALTVAVAAPVAEVWPEEISASGWTAAWQEAVISAEVAGQKITAINADVGDLVTEGDVLVDLSRASLENAIQELDATLESARAALEQATADADRARRLGETGSGSISQQQISEYLVAERQAKADVSSAEAALASARLDLENTQVRAVSSGVISSRSAALGAVTSQGEELFRLIRDNRIEWQAEVPLRQMFRLAVGTEARIPTPIGEITGHVRRIAPQASETNGRVKVYVELDQLPGEVDPKIGVMISGVFLLGSSEALHVPASAVVLQDGFSYVFVLEGADIVHRQRVETGRRQDDRVEILSGVTAGDRIVQAGGAFLSDGATVRVSTATGDSQ